MSITFRIATPADDKVGPIATINARQLAAFRSCLRKEGERIGAILLDTDGADDAFLSYHFEARVCPLALASIATVFDFATEVIAVVEEAQFRARRVSVYLSRRRRSQRLSRLPPCTRGDVLLPSEDKISHREFRRCR